MCSACGDAGLECNPEEPDAGGGSDAGEIPDDAAGTNPVPDDAGNGAGGSNPTVDGSSNDDAGSEPGAGGSSNDASTPIAGRANDAGDSDHSPAGGKGNDDTDDGSTIKGRYSGSCTYSPATTRNNDALLLGLLAATVFVRRRPRHGA
jgi:hypothetical protein